MSNIFITIKNFFRFYKWMLLPVIPMLIFVGFIFYFFSTPSTTPQPSNNLPTSVPSTPTVSPTEETAESGSESELDENIESRPDFHKKETRSDGSVVYIFTSENPNRTNNIILDKNGELVFSRTLNSIKAPMAPVSVLMESFGEPEKIINGSKFYGQQANVYIYSSIGLVFIGNPQTDQAFEEQDFPPMSVDAYLQRFGNQN